MGSLRGRSGIRKAGSCRCYTSHLPGRCTGGACFLLSVPFSWPCSCSFRPRSSLSFLAELRSGRTVPPSPLVRSSISRRTFRRIYSLVRTDGGWIHTYFVRRYPSLVRNPRLSRSFTAKFRIELGSCNRHSWLEWPYDQRQNQYPHGNTSVKICSIPHRRWSCPMAAHFPGPPPKNEHPLHTPLAQSSRT